MGAKINALKGFGLGLLQLVPALVVFPVAGVLSIFDGIRPGGRLLTLLWGPVHGLYRALLFPAHQARRGYKVTKDTASVEEQYGFKEVARRVFQGSPFRRYLQKTDDKSGHYSKISLPATVALVLSEFIEQVVLSPLTYLTAVWDNVKRSWNEARWNDAHPARHDRAVQVAMISRFKAIGPALWGGFTGLFIGVYNVVKAVLYAPILVAQASRWRADYHEPVAGSEGTVLSRKYAVFPSVGVNDSDGNGQNYAKRPLFAYRKAAVQTRGRRSVSLTKAADDLPSKLKVGSPYGYL